MSSGKKEKKQSEMEKVFEDKIKTQMKKAYWDLVIEELKNNKSDLFIKIIIEIKQKLIHIVGKNKDFKNEFSEYLDEEFIESKIKNGVFDFTELGKILNYVIEYIKQFQAPIHDKEVNDFNEKMMNTVNEENFYEYIPECIEFIMTSLDRLIKEVDYYREKFNL
jgi:hypothetical protein